MEIVNQLEFVKQRLTGMNTKERTQLALDTDTSMRTLYHMAEASSKPSYDTVFRVYSTMAKQKTRVKK